jgi:hypothetical protein
MPFKRKAGYAFFATGLVVLLAGCGGKQNPWEAHTGVSNWFVNGLWDGLCAPWILVFLNWIGPHHHQLYTRNAYFWYYPLCLFGALVSVLVLLGILRQILVWLLLFFRGLARV